MEFKVHFATKPELQNTHKSLELGPCTRDDSLNSVTFMLKGTFLFGAVGVIKRV
jgi:hypothetical protein